MYMHVRTVYTRVHAHVYCVCVRVCVRVCARVYVSVVHLLAGHPHDIGAERAQRLVQLGGGRGMNGMVNGMVNGIVNGVPPLGWRRTDPWPVPTLGGWRADPNHTRRLIHTCWRQPDLVGDLTGRRCGRSFRVRLHALPMASAAVCRGLVFGLGIGRQAPGGRPSSLEVGRHLSGRRESNVRQ